MVVTLDKSYTTHDYTTPHIVYIHIYYLYIISYTTLYTYTYTLTVHVYIAQHERLPLNPLYIIQTRVRAVEEAAVQY